jgi:hypothetical protein
MCRKYINHIDTPLLSPFIHPFQLGITFKGESQCGHITQSEDTGQFLELIGKVRWGWRVRNKTAGS